MPSIIVRSFRDSTLFLAAHSGATKYWHWTSNRAKALPFTTGSEAFPLAERAAKEYGAVCLVQDATGAFLEPKAARAAQRQALIRTAALKRRAEPQTQTADEPEVSPHCAEHVAFTDGCSSCYDSHLLRSN